MARRIVALLCSMAWDNKVQYIQQYTEARLRGLPFMRIYEADEIANFAFEDSFNLITGELIENMYLFLFILYDHSTPLQSDREISINEKTMPIRRTQVLSEIG